MKFVAEVELGNDAMLTYEDVRKAFDVALTGMFDAKNDAHVGDSGSIWDVNGNKVGVWRVKR